ncbi:MAG: BrnA antitoxin family protein, partial [Microvirga sp.]
PDARPYTDEEWAEVEFIRPEKVPVGLKLDADVLAWFKSRGRGYQTRINAVLRRYMEAQRRAGV